jgi:hypothetical protein
MPRPPHSSWFDHLNNIWWWVQILVMHYSTLPCYLVPFRPKYPPQHPILEQPQPMFLPQCERPSFTPIQNNRQIIVLFILIFVFLDNKLEDRRSCTEW